MRLALPGEYSVFTYLEDVYDVPIPEVTTCKYFNDSNLIGALYVHLSSASVRESQVALDAPSSKQ